MFPLNLRIIIGDVSAIKRNHNKLNTYLWPSASGSKPVIRRLSTVSRDQKWLHDIRTGSGITIQTPEVAALHQKKITSAPEMRTSALLMGGVW